MWIGVHNESYLGQADFKLGLEENKGCDQIERWKRGAPKEKIRMLKTSSKMFTKIRGYLRDGKLICICWLNHNGF